jgi:hypothetical protein
LIIAVRTTVQLALVTVAHVTLRTGRWRTTDRIRGYGSSVSPR